MRGRRGRISFVRNGSSDIRSDMDSIFDKVASASRRTALWVAFCVCLWPAIAFAVAGDEATHEDDHREDVLELPEVHVHGLPLNKDQQLGPVSKATPWPAIPPGLDGKELDDWMKVRMLVSKDAKVTVVVLEPAKHRELTIAGMAALNKWTFEPQLRGDEPIDGELTVRIHFRTR
jgi:hypothetical protein